MTIESSRIAVFPWSSLGLIHLSAISQSLLNTWCFIYTWTQTVRESSLSSPCFQSSYIYSKPMHKWLLFFVSCFPDHFVIPGQAMPSFPTLPVDLEVIKMLVL